MFETNKIKGNTPSKIPVYQHKSRKPVHIVKIDEVIIVNPSDDQQISCSPKFCTIEHEITPPRNITKVQNNFEESDLTFTTLSQHQFHNWTAQNLQNDSQSFIANSSSDLKQQNSKNFPDNRIKTVLAKGKIRAEAIQTGFGKADATLPVLRSPIIDLTSQNCVPIPKTNNKFQKSPQIIKNSLDESTKSRLKEEQVIVSSQNFNHELLERVEKIVKANLNMTADVLKICESMAKIMSVFSTREISDKIPFTFPLVCIKDVLDLENWVKSDEQNYSLWVNIISIELIYFLLNKKKI